MIYRLAAGRLFSAAVRVVFLLGVFTLVDAQEATAPTPAAVSRHPLEIRALTDPEGVMRELPGRIQAATAAKDYKELALLHLAESNACRVIADWPCQSNAAANARKAADMANLPELQARGLILESRGRMALQDFSRTSQLLGEAERILKQQSYPELIADVYLAYSSLSYAIGKHAKAAEYAQLGLIALGDNPALLIRVRLQRNQARAMAQLGNTAGARTVLKQALELVDKIQDPKLSAELHLEDARIARLTGDIPTQLANGRRILALGAQLSNSQLTGMGHEVLGLAALNQKDNISAERELRLAYTSFRDLKLERDERRVLRSLIKSLLGRGIPRAELEILMARSLALEATLEADDRNMAADDFEARLKYAQQELEVQRLEAAAALATERAAALADQQRMTMIVAVLSLGLLAVFIVLLAMQRRFNARLKQALANLQESESRYRMLAENSRDLVVRMRLDGERLYVSPAAKDLLGMEPAEVAKPGWDLVHPDDRAQLIAAICDLGEDGGSATVVYRARHADGHYVWIEALARLVPKPDDGGPPEIIYSGRDISARVRAEQALSISESHMRAVTDNIPALIACVDKDQRYTFANAFTGKVFGVASQDMIGRTMREIRGEELYDDMKPYVEAALRGEFVSYEGTGVALGKPYHYQSNYVPNRDADGNLQGFYALTFDITDLKLAEAELDRLARIDSLSGVANRRYFEERLTDALARSRRQQTALALLCLDIDHFKSINDTYGHAVGDAVIVAFVATLQSCIREDDVVARMGGDEFVLLIEQAAPDSGENVAKKLLAIMQQPINVDGVALNVSASIGVAFATHATSATALIGLADQAMYSAKQSGRNTYKLAVGE